MKRKRPCQHYRRIKTRKGRKRVLVNKGRRKRRRSINLRRQSLSDKTRAILDAKERLKMLQDPTLNIPEEDKEIIKKRAQEELDTLVSQNPQLAKKIDLSQFSQEMKDKGREMEEREKTGKTVYRSSLREQTTLGDIFKKKKNFSAFPQYPQQQYDYVSGVIRNKRQENINNKRTLDRVRIRPTHTIREEIVKDQRIDSLKRQIVNNQRDIDRLNKIYFPKNAR